MRLDDAVCANLFPLGCGDRGPFRSDGPGRGGEPHRGKASKEARKGLPVKEIEGVIREYLLRNPEVVEDALRRLQEKRQRAKAAATKRVIARRARDLFRDPESPVGGNPDGDVTLVEFFDYRCVHCRRIAPMMSKAEQGDPNLRIVYKEFPHSGARFLFGLPGGAGFPPAGKIPCLP